MRNLRTFQPQTSSWYKIAPFSSARFFQRSRVDQPASAKDVRRIEVLSLTGLLQPVPGPSQFPLDRVFRVTRSAFK